MRGDQPSEQSMTEHSDVAANPTVTAIVTTYDRPTHLRRALESVHAQTYDDLELVVVDDHSPTSARDVVAEVDADRFTDVHFQRHETNRGANAARNTAMGFATGEFVAFLDDDDQWLPEKIEKQLGAFRECGPDVGVVYAGKRVLTEDGAEDRIPPAVDGDLTKVLLCENVVNTISTLMVRSDVAKATPLDESYPSWADLEWYIRLSERTSFAVIQEPLIVYEFDSHNRLSEDVWKKIAAYHRYLEDFDDLASEYGPLFRRKMRGWAAFRVGSTALYAGEYGQARRFIGLAVKRYPFETRFLKYLLATLGGRYSHGFARALKRVAGGARNRFANRA